MHPLEALGLDREADERAVKRAYALRLRKARPDDDPEAFQALNETYRAALAHLRWRAENPEGEGAEEAEDQAAAYEEPAAFGDSRVLSQADFERLIGNPRWEGPRDTEPRAEPERSEPFRLDLGEFLERLCDEARTLDEFGLKRWIDRETADWPLAIRPHVAQDLLHLMLNTELDLTSGQLEVVVHAFGLDDVLVIADPIGLEKLRAWVAERQRAGELARLFEPGRRAELRRVMAQPERGRHSAFATTMIAYLLTNRHAYDWAYCLRPYPFLNGMVMRFLRHIDNGRFDALPPSIDRKALDFWVWAETRRHANRPLRYLVLGIGLAALLVNFIATSDRARPPASQDSRSSRALVGAALEQQRREGVFARRIDQLAGMKSEEGIPALEAFLRELPQPPWSNLMEEVVALAHYNRGVDLDDVGRTDEAIAAYETVDRIFVGSTHWPTQLVVAKALVNLGYIDTDRGAYRESLAAFQKVLARYGEIRNEQVDLQVAKALKGRASAFDKLGELDEVRHALDQLLKRFGDRQEGDLGDLVKRARDQRRMLEVRMALPAEPGASPGAVTTDTSPREVPR